MVKVTWLGHACFLIEGKEARLLIDPYKGGVFPGFDIYLTAFEDKIGRIDYVISTHDHADHNYFAISPEAKKIRAVDKIDTKTDLGKGVLLECYRVDHGFGRGKCAGVLLTVDDVKVYHFGDTYKYNQRSLKGLKERNVDLALIPVGGLYTMGPKEAVEALQILNAKNVIPMHYKIPGKVTLVPHTLQDFLGEAEGKVVGKIVPLKIGESFEI